MLKAARMLLDLSEASLAQQAKLTIKFVSQAEATPIGVPASAIEPLLKFFKSQGIEFVSRSSGAVGVFLKGTARR